MPNKLLTKLFERYIKPEFVHCNECGRGARLVWHNLTDYTIEPIDVETTVDVVYTTKGLNINIDVASDKWLMVWVGLRQVFLCDKCQARRRAWAMSTFNISPATVLPQHAQKQPKEVSNLANQKATPPDDYLDLPWLKDLDR